jgi:hypothetical protein
MEECMVILWDMVLLGCVGGLLPDLIRLAKNRSQQMLKDDIVNPAFWVSIVIQTLLGGFSAILFSAVDIKQAVAYGFGAPEFISLLASKQLKSEEDRSAPNLSFLDKLRAWWAI